MASEMPSSGGRLVFNGINGATGEYLVPPASPKEVAAWARGGRIEANHLKDLKRKARARTESFLVRYGVAPEKIEEAGWGVIFAHDANPAVREALRPLLDLRKRQASAVKEVRYKEFAERAGYRTGEGETAQAFLSNRGIGPGQPDPDRVPYYLLIVGDPEAIPFSFQYQLDVQYAVGRIWFDTPEEYARYAQSVVAAESGAFKLARRAVLFGTHNPGDGATELSSQQLVTPLAKRLPELLGGRQPKWEIETVVGAGATKAKLGGLLGGPDTPALLFTASHGMGFPAGSREQDQAQGALLCQDWPGPADWPRGKPIPPELYFAAADVPDAARLGGLVAFHFACYGAGTPRKDDYPTSPDAPPPEIAPRAFVARLPRRLLGHPKGGALAVIGHVERAWGCSIRWENAGQQIQPFEDALRAMMEGKQVGLAFEGINQRYASIGVDLSALLQDISRGDVPADDWDLAERWTANNDARSYVILGDPAVRLPLAADGVAATTGRVEIAPVVIDSRTSAGGGGGAGAAEKGRPGDAKPKEQTVKDHAAAQPQPPQSLSPPDERASDRPAMRAGDAGAAIGGNGQSVTVTIPLTLTLTVGAPVAVGAAVGAAGAAQPAVGGGFAGAGAGRADATTSAAAADASFAISIDPDYSNREGYDPEFLGAGGQVVPLPRLSAAQRRDAAVLKDVDGGGGDGQDPHELKYHHFSVVLNARRRLAFFTAVNIDGRTSRGPKWETDRWIFDPRVDQDEQVGNEFYGRPFDRGHLVRRLDPAWGRSPAVIKAANDDTFHWSNCSPQHARFNEGKNLWAGLEDYLLEKAAGERKRMTVFTGPVFADDDPEFKGVAVPLRFWKVAVVARPDGRLATAAFVVTQEDLVRQVVSFAPVDVARTFQVPVRRVEQLSKLDFGKLRDADVGSVDSFGITAGGGGTSFAPGGAGVAEGVPLHSFDDVRLPSDAGAAAPATAGGTAPAAFDAGAAGEAAAVPSAGGGGVIGAGGATVPPPPEQVPGTDARYYLVAYDEDSRERPRTAPPVGLVSQMVLDAVTRAPVTDVMLFSHGWMGDVPSAREQYNGWIAAMLADQADRTRARAVRPDFRPLLVGIHWPSLPWGDESFATAVSFSIAGGAPAPAGTSGGANGGAGGGGKAGGKHAGRPGGTAAAGTSSAAVEEMAEEYVRRLADTPAERQKVREPLRAVMAAVHAVRASNQPDPPRLPAELADAYRALDQAVGLPARGVAAAPGADREKFDPEAVYEDAHAGRPVASGGPAGMSFGLHLPSRDDLLAPLRTLSFWKMKDRARQVGENAVNPLLEQLQHATAGRQVRFHLMGHSFGAIVVSAAVAGAAGRAPLPQRVDSLCLVQGALPLWAFCSSIPSDPGTPGYFHRLFDPNQPRVRGPVVTTQSRFDTAVGTWYPRAARARSQVAFAAPGQFPKYGAVGAFGIQGPGLNVVNAAMLPADAAYGLAGGRIYNVDGSAYIREGGGFSGAHSDIRRPEVAHLVWSAMMGF